MGQNNQKRDAKERKNKNDKQTRKIEHSEKSMSDQLTLSTNNMRAQLKESLIDPLQKIMRSGRAG